MTSTNRPPRKPVRFNVRPITPQHWGFLDWLVRTTDCEVSVPLYPLAPESTSTDTLAWVHAVHAQLTTRHAPEAIHSMGDFAGGGLALAQTLWDAGQPRAAQMVLITPWVDVAVPHPAAVQTARRDPMLALAGGRARGGAPVCRCAAAGPPGSEPRMGRCGALELHRGEGLVHVWPLLPVPESRAARAAIARRFEA